MIQRDKSPNGAKDAATEKYSSKFCRKNYKKGGTSPVKAPAPLLKSPLSANRTPQIPQKPLAPDLHQ